MNDKKQKRKIMKKTLSILLTLLTLISVVYGCTFFAFAETTTKYWEPRPNCQDSLGCVNDEPADGIGSDYNAEFNTHTYYYYGYGQFIRWEFPTLTEGKDYEIVAQNNGNSITVEFKNEENSPPYINAIVDFKDETAYTQKESTPKTQTTTKTKTTTKTETTALQTTTEITTEIKTAENAENNNIFSANRPVIIGSIVAIILCSAIIAVFVKKKTA